MMYIFQIVFFISCINVEKFIVITWVNLIEVKVMIIYPFHNLRSFQGVKSDSINCIKFENFVDYFNLFTFNSLVNSKAIYKK